MVSNMVKIALASLLLASTAFAGSRGFRLYASQTSGDYTYGEANVVVRWKGTTTAQFTVPTTGTWYFVVTAYNDYGESGPSNEVSGAFTAGEIVHLAWDAPKWHPTLMRAIGVVK